MRCSRSSFRLNLGVRVKVDSFQAWLCMQYEQSQLKADVGDSRLRIDVAMMIQGDAS